ncbi:MAG: endopeptidase La [Anaerolineales bacterium]|nr:endopeptidase La [Anaerolineales bacterium]
MNRYFRWPDLPADFSGFIHRKAEDLYDIPDAEQADDGLVHCSVLPLKDLVLFPNMVTPLFLESESSMQAVEQAITTGQTMIAVAQIDPEDPDPGPEDLFPVGTEIAVGRLMQIPDGTSSVLTQGRRRVQIVEFISDGPYLRALARPVEEIAQQDKETTALMRVVLTLFEKYVEMNRSLPDEAYIYALNIDNPAWLGDLIASTLSISSLEAQTILEVFDPVTRLQQISVLLGRELDVLELENEIHSKVQGEFDRSQREMYLREQMKTIQTELGEFDLLTQDVLELREKIEMLEAPEEVRSRAEKEVIRLSQMPSMSPEVGIIRTYLEWLLELPWTTYTSDNLDVTNAAGVLNRDHFGLKDPKERILEYIAVQHLAGEKQRQPILCFVGPPGTGKTSIGRSIAEALGRKFIRISLGGIRDEAEIRGHRRTYIGALPGRIIQAIRRAESANPLFMLDEIDKLGIDFRGDPASALLEVLDPEQNNSFSDHYLEVPFDLSRVLFITTANTLETIPSALLDRMEVIEFPGYIEEEKIKIARDFLIPRQLERNGFDPDALQFTTETLQRLIREYTWEAGVRNLEREISKICRKVARKKVEGKKILKRVQPERLEKLLGPSQMTPPQLEDNDMVGIAFGLAWTENGGEIIEIEVSFVEGKGNLQITGQVGDVMQESAQAALTYIKSRADVLDIDPELFEKCDIHIHIPETAIPKDGPSAGITMATALVSAATERPVRRDIAMTGEITLRGRVLPVGGIREKVMAGYRMKLKTVLIPAVNDRHLVDIPRIVRSSLEIKLVRHMDEVLEIALAEAD